MEQKKDNQFETIEPLARDARVAQSRGVAQRAPAKAVFWWLAGAIGIVAVAGMLLLLLPDFLARSGEKSVVTTNLIDEASNRIENQAAQANSKRTLLFEKWLKLEGMNVSLWSELRASRALELLQGGEQKISELQYREALKLLDESDALFTALINEAPGIAADRRAAGWQAFNSGNAEKASEHFKIVLAINPDDSEVRDALARTASLDQLIVLSRAARDLEAKGEFAEAIKILDEALRMDPGNKEWQASQNRLRTALADRRFKSTMSQVFSALAVNDFAATGLALDRAAALRPDAPEVRDARTRLEQTRRNLRIAALQERAVAADVAEDWETAISHYSEMMRVDATLVAAQQGRDRARRLASLTTRAESLLAKPAFSKTDVRRNTENLLQQIDSVTTHAPTLQELAVRLEEGLRLAKVPVKVQLRSDQLTDVQVYRIGRLGLFASHELELLPGQYTIIGRRDGYRDVRAQLVIEPGQDPDPLMIRCEEQI